MSGRGRSATATVPVTGGKFKLSGTVHGGQQPVVASQVFLYAAGSAGYGSASRSLLAAPGYAVTDGNGSFNITGDYSCGSTDEVYLLAVGGDAGGGPNSNIYLMDGLGSCTTLLNNAATTVVTVNEVTTVASVYALAPYLAGPVALGAPGSDLTGLVQAFSSIQTMVSANGSAAATAAGGQATVPQATINSLADSLASCINSSSPFSECSSLYTATTVGSTAPADPISAMISVAQHPLNNVSTIFTLAPAKPPFQPTLAASPGNWSFATAYRGDVLTYHNDNSRTGVQPGETALTTANVATSTFGLRYTFPVDGYLWTQPLYVGGYTMSDGAAHNVVFAATAHSSVYAFDADNNNPAAGYLWQDALVGPGEIAIPNNAYYNCVDMPVESGIAGTPVVDRTTGTLYVVSVTQNTASGTIIQRLHALNLGDGTEKFGGPTVIAASSPIAFDAGPEHQHTALMLANSQVVITWASHCDEGVYHGWVMGYHAGNIAQQDWTYVDTPVGYEGGIWMGIGGPSVDANGNIFLVPGNGTFDQDAGGSDTAEGPIRLAPSATGASFSLADYFVPSNQATLSQKDSDLGTTNALLFSDPASGVAPNLMVTTDKEGYLYVVNQANMGGYVTGPGGTDGNVQKIAPGGVIFSNMVYFQGKLYLGTGGSTLEALAYLPGTATTAGHFAGSASSLSSNYFSNGRGEGGASPVISANGTGNAIVWAVDRGGANAILYAYDAANLGTMLYSSSQAAGSRDLGPKPIKFSSATVGGGHVFVPGAASLAVYGLLP